MSLLYFLARRLATAIFVLFGVSLIVFILAHSLTSDPVAIWLGKAASLHPELVKLYVQRYHLNEPLYVQYFYYIAGMLQGNWGFSPHLGQTISAVIARTLPYTIQLMFFSFVFTIILGIGLGALAAKFVNRLPDTIIRIFYMAGTAAPAFFLALALIVIFALVIPVLPTGGTISPTVQLAIPLTGIPIPDALLEGNLPSFNSQLQHILLPSLANSLGIFGVVTRLLRSSMLDTMGSNYIRTARAKGVTENAVIFKHALKNSLIPVITILGLLVNVFIVSSIFVEYIFAYPGVGNFAVESVLNSDYPGILSTTLLFAIMIVVGNFIADLLYGVVDPRMRLTGG